MAEEFKEFPIKIAHGSRGNYFPCMAIGTYGLVEQDLIELFKSYPYDELMIDTAYKYGNEQDVSSALSKSGYPKERVHFIGKISYNQQVNGRSVREELLDTLKRLKIDVIDFYLIHSPRYEGYLETWQQLLSLKKTGYIKEIGVSNFTEENIERLFELSGEYPAVNQIVYNPLNKTEKAERLIEYCSYNGISIQVAMPFGGSENCVKLNAQKRRIIIENICNRNFMSIIGTHRQEHMIQNFQFLEVLKDVNRT